MRIFVVRISRGTQWVEVVKEARNSAVAAQEACDEWQASMDELDWVEPVRNREIGQEWLKEKALMTGTVKAADPQGLEADWPETEAS